MKYIVVSFSDRICWKIPASVIAESRAKYYAEVDSARGDGDYDEVYKEEYDYTLSNISEIEDWAKNSMNWEDVKDHAVLYRSDDSDYEQEWCNSSFDFIDE